MKKNVEVCVASLSAMTAWMDPETACWMGEAEIVRLAAMGSRMRRRQFIAGHWLARDLAAKSTGTKPQDWLLVAAPNGVPGLVRRDTGPTQGMHVSLSHSGEWLAAAIAPFPLGIDLESTGRVRDWLALAGLVFAREECEQLRRLPEADRQELFFRYWTLKEAWGKRDGGGLRLSGAGTPCARECDEHESVAVTWEFDGDCVALTGERGMRISASGIPATARQLFWRFET